MTTQQRNATDQLASHNLHLMKF